MIKLIKDFPIIFEEGPIARSYLQLFRVLGLKNKKILYLLDNNYYFKRISYYMQIKKNLYYPLKFIKDKKVINLIRQFQEFFDFDKNYVFEMYNKKYFSDLENFFFINSHKVNSKIFVETVDDLEEKILINTSKQIYKDFTHGKQILHIHPGFLPKIRGADSSLNSILQFNELGVTSFFISKSIDNGEIINRSNYKFQKFKFDVSDYSIKDIYRIWYSFFDPLLRAKHLNFLINNDKEIGNSLKINKLEFDNSKYYTFLSNKQLQEVFDKVFLHVL